MPIYLGQAKLQNKDTANKGSAVPSETDLSSERKCCVLFCTISTSAILSSQKIYTISDFTKHLYSSNTFPKLESYAACRRKKGKL